MSTVFFESSNTDAERRQMLHRGDVLVFGPRPETIRLCARMAELIEGETLNLQAPVSLSPSTFQSAVTRLRKLAGRDPAALAALTELLAAFGCDLRRTYRHRLYLRVVPPVGESGPAQPAFHAAPHRDVWLSAPQCQINWWMPISELSEDCCLLLYPRFWQVPISNDSAEFDYSTFKKRFANAYGGSNMASNPIPPVNHPKALAPIDSGEALRLICPVGGLILFSAAHLHASARNRSGRVRFSVDFRTCHADDVEQNAGPPAVDNDCTGSNLTDSRRVADGAPFGSGA
jgi:ectoine hydroxylase-related dioxygenase (phytanoyl-CoA dioxygenase family)